MGDTESRIEHVTVYARGARVRRVATMPGPAPSRMRIVGLPLEEITQVTARALDERGLVTWSVELPPHGRRVVTLEYKVKSQRGVAGL